MAISDVAPPSGVPLPQYIVDDISTLLTMLQLVLLSAAVASAVALIVIGTSLVRSVRAGNSRRTADNTARLFHTQLSGSFLLVASLACAALTAVAAQG